jgi:DNA-binding beta-propeller fold protein YncE
VTSIRQHIQRVLVPLVALSLAISACTISVFDDADDHEHEPGTGEHDHADEEAIGIDHHGNPIFDEEERVYEQVSADGVSVEFTVENFIGVGGRGGELAPRLVEGEHANLQFHIVDASGVPLGGLAPAVWIDPAIGDVDCETRIDGYLSGTLDRRPAIDLNSYFILGMNRDSTISVIDPMINVGGMTNLFSVIILQARAQDWEMVPQQARLFVTMPSLDRIAVVDLDAFLVEDNVDVGGTPEAIVVEPGGQRVWIPLGGESGVSVVDAESLSVRSLDTGPGSGAIAFSPAGHRAIIGTTSGVVVLDTASLDEVARVPLSGAAAAAAVSPASGDVYVTQPDTGVISILDADSGAGAVHLQVDRGVSDIEFSADGTWGVAVNPEAEKAYIIEASTRRITHQVPVAGGPDQVVFTDAAAYIHTSGSPSVTAIPLNEIDPSGNVSVLTVPIGSRPSGHADAGLGADAITVTPDGKSLLIPNPVDDTVYFYTEGGQAEAGGFQGHTLQPSAVAIVDRTLKEPSPGVYTGSIRIPQAGEFVVAFLLDQPRVLHCFTFTARAAEEGIEGVAASAADLTILSEATGRSGEPHELRFSLANGDTGDPMSGLEDVFVLVTQTGGNWNSRLTAAPSGDGEYSVSVVPPQVGVYKVFFTIPSLGLDFEKLPQITLTATE